MAAKCLRKPVVLHPPKFRPAENTRTCPSQKIKTERGVFAANNPPPRADVSVANERGQNWPKRAGSCRSARGLALNIGLVLRGWKVATTRSTCEHLKSCCMLSGRPAADRERRVADDGQQPEALLRKCSRACLGWPNKSHRLCERALSLTSFCKCNTK